MGVYRRIEGVNNDEDVGEGDVYVRYAYRIAGDRLRYLGIDEQVEDRTVNNRH